MVNVPLYPLLLKPLLVARLWGADRLGALHGLAAPPSDAGAHTPVGESWLLCDDNVVVNGALAGQKVVDVVARMGAPLLGTHNVAAYGQKLALMAKFLDTAGDLSIQVHPDDAYALEHEAHTGHLGKAEAWYVLEAEPGASVVWGFERDVTEPEVRSMIAAGTLEEALNRLPVAPGAVVVNPAGMVHAVGKGLLLFEIQQSSDITYRLYDYGRRDANGELRELHVDKALAVADLSRADIGALAGAADGRVVDGWRLLVDCPEFTLESARLDGGARQTAELACATSSLTFDLLVVVSGGVDVLPPGPRSGRGFAEVSLGVGDAALLPAALGAYALRGAGEVLRSRVNQPTRARGD